MKIRLSRMLSIPYVLLLFLLLGGMAAILSVAVHESVLEFGDRSEEIIANRVAEQVENYLKAPYHLVKLNRSEIKNLSDLKALQNRFYAQLTAFDQVSALFAANQEKGFAGVERYPDQSLVRTYSGPETNFAFSTYGLDLAGRPGPLLKQLPGYDPRIRPYYQQAQASSDLSWTGVYYFPLHKSLYVSVVAPVQDDQGSFLGVLAAASSIGNFKLFLQETKLGDGSRIYLLDERGLLVASSLESTLIQEGEQVRRRSYLEIAAPLSQQLAHLLPMLGDRLAPQTELIKKHLEGAKGEIDHLYIKPFNLIGGLHWRLVVFTPSQDLVGSAARIKEKLYWTAMVGLFLALVLGSILSLPLSKPIIRLSQASQVVSKGHWNHPLPQSAVLEINQLTASFDHMSKELQASFDRLEAKVKERTAELETAIEKHKETEVALLQAKLAAEKADRTKSAFLANMSHEIRTPLNAILGFAEVLASEAHQPTQKKQAQVILQAGRNLLNLINDVLDLAKAEADEQMHQSPTCLGELLQETQTLFALKAQEKALDLDLDIEKGLPSCFLLDGARLRQILLNLVGNAVKFTQRGQVLIQALGEPAGKDLWNLAILVKDTGPGIKEADQKKIFERFYQVDGTSQNLGGTGLGLAICHSLAQRLGARIELNSQPGLGSEFHVILDGVQALDHSLSGSKQQEQPSLLHFPASRVLVVDDQPEGLELLSQLLSRCSILPILADSSQNLDQLLQESQPDLVMVNLSNRNRQASELAQSWRNQLPALPPLVAVSASVLPEDQQAARQAGFDFFLGKPFSQMDLCRCLSAFLPCREQNQDSSCPEPFVFQLSSKKQQSRLLHGLHALEDLWSKAKQSQMFGLVVELCQKVQSLGEQEDQPTLVAWAKELQAAAQAYDLTEMAQRLADWPRLLAELQSWQGASLAMGQERASGDL